jgi:hypothetical protein
VVTLPVSESLARPTLLAYCEQTKTLVVYDDKDKRVMAIHSSCLERGVSFPVCMTNVFALTMTAQEIIVCGRAVPDEDALPAGKVFPAVDILVFDYEGQLTKDATLKDLDVTSVAALQNKEGQLELYVADRNSRGILVYAFEGETIRNCLPLVFNGASHVAYSHSTGELVTCLNEPQEVVIFSQDGAIKHVFPWTDEPEVECLGLAVCPRTRLIAIRTLFNVIVFDGDGCRQETLSLSRPQCSDAENLGIVFLADCLNGLVLAQPCSGKVELWIK